MFKHVYVSTKDRKGHTHNYKLTGDQTIPAGEEVTDVRLPSQNLREMLHPDVVAKLTAAYGTTAPGLPVQQRRRSRGKRGAKA